MSPIREAYPKEFPDAAVLEGGNVSKSLARTIYPPIVQQLAVPIRVHNRHLARGRMQAWRDRSRHVTLFCHISKKKHDVDDTDDMASTRKN